MQQDMDNGLLLTGTAYVRNRRIADAARVELGNVVSLKLKANSETKKRISRKKESAGSALDSVTIKDAVEVSLSSDTFNKLTLAMALSGKSAELAADVKTVTDEAVNVSAKGAFLELKHRNIDADSLKVKNAANATVKAEYIEINPTLGWIRIKTGTDNVNTGEDIKVSYKTRAGGGMRIEAGTENDYDFEFWLDGFNRAGQKNFVLHIPSMVIAPNGEIDWLGDDYAAAEFSGTAVLVGGQKAAYSYEEFD